ncbi:MAG: NINE protein [Bifidobacterium pseudolongum]|nr:NINE protein [Bifidobacterium pseudolongum]
MTDPTNPNINPAPSNDETPAAYTGGTTADANQQDIEVTETFTTAMPQMPDLPPNPNGTMDDPYSADQQATTAMPNVAAHTANPYTQPATANTPQYGQPASNPYTQPAADQYAQPAADPYTQPSADPYGQQYAQPQYGQPAPGTPTYAAVPTGYIPRNKILAGLLALFFGALGIHNFYLGFTGKAIAQVLLTCLGWILFGLGPIAAIIWSTVEGVQILTSNYGTPAHRDARGVELVD